MQIKQFVQFYKIQVNSIILIYVILFYLCFFCLPNKQQRIQTLTHYIHDLTISFKDMVYKKDFDNVSSINRVVLKQIAVLLCYCVVVLLCH